MNDDRMQGNWKQFKGKVQEQWGKLTNDDLDVIAGKREQRTRIRDANRHERRSDVRELVRLELHEREGAPKTTSVTMDTTVMSGFLIAKGSA